MLNLELKLLIFVPAVFEPYKDSKVELLGPKLLFIALNLGGLALGVWKVRCFIPSIILRLQEALNLCFSNVLRYFTRLV